MANPRSVNLAMAKPRSISLVPRDMSTLHQKRVTPIWKEMSNTSPYPTEQSQEWRRESTQEEGTWQQDRRSMNLVMEKPRFISLVPYNMSVKFFSQDMSDSGNRVNVEVEPGSVRTHTWKQMANTSPYATRRSQERKLEQTRKEPSWKNSKGAMAPTRNVAAKQEQSAGTSKNKSGTEFRTVQNLMQKKCGITEGSSKDELGPMRANIWIWRLCHLH